MADAFYSSGDYQAAFLALLPRGRVWPKALGALQADLAAGLAPTFNRHDQRARQLLVDAFPATSEEVLPEWEASLGLPDPCAGPAATIPQRQAQVVARLMDSGGQSAQHFIDFAANLGFTITVSYFSPFRCGVGRCGEPIYGLDWIFAWQVNAPDASFQPNAVLECEIRARMPANTYVLFAYSEPGQLDFSFDDGRNTAFLGAIRRRKPPARTQARISMHRIDTPSATPALPAPAPAGEPGYWTNGDPASATPATIFDQDWANAVQEEIAHVIEEAGIALDKTNRNQLFAAIMALVGGGTAGLATEAWVTAGFDPLGAAAAAQAAAETHSDAHADAAAATAQGNAEAHADAAAATAQTNAEAYADAKFTGSMTDTGYWEADGMIFQWVKGATSTGNGDEIFFQTAFPNACFGAVMVEAAAGGWLGNPTVHGVNSVSVGSATVSTMKASGSSWSYAGSVSFFLIAVGF